MSPTSDQASERTPERNHAATPSAAETQDIRDQIAADRTELQQTIEALVAKTDVKARAHDKAADAARVVQDKAEAVTHAVQDKAEAVTHAVQDKAEAVTHGIQATATEAANRVQDATPRSLRSLVTAAVDGLRRQWMPLASALGAVLAMTAVDRLRHRRG